MIERQIITSSPYIGNSEGTRSVLELECGHTVDASMDELLAARVYGMRAQAAATIGCPECDSILDRVSKANP